MTLQSQRSDHGGMTSQEIGDRLAIRELFDAYAHCADRRDVEGQMSPFHAGYGIPGLHGQPQGRGLAGDPRSRRPAPRLREPRHLSTTHFNGQSTVAWVGETATGVSYCLALHVKVEGAGRSLMIASIRYLDRFVKKDGRWYFATAEADGRLDRRPPARHRLSRSAARARRRTCCASGAGDLYSTHRFSRSISSK
jgi:SnoaL-like domain